jgi:3-oxoacyl-[acyl-carrier protein] reductase
MRIEDWDQIMGVNVRAPFALMRGFSLQMIREEIKGSFVNISSGAARKMRRTAVTYCMSKTALDRMSKGFALELAEYGIRVNCLEPGFAKGSSVSRLSEEHVEQVLSSIPLGGEISKNDIGQAALYLASSAARNITGTTLSVDGGNSAGTMDVYQEKKRAL